ncbi:MAG TPA: NmrA/HSCARG family protein [Kofleriaceae bacterium]|jgi:uncharacterized protein YbjT (DUF2867 family)|nr:NmrA/HSCARG family protein [Kofleriaceae bacterium]
MNEQQKVIVVFGATGQQGGATARALVRDGWRVRALVRDPGGAKARALAALGVDVVAGDLGDRASIDRAVQGAHGVFSVQPSSGQPEYGVTDDDERRFGVAVADAARAAGVRHLVYSSVGGLRRGTGVGHFESKLQVEDHVRGLDLAATIVRPTAFMEILLQPHFGLASGQLTFFLAGDRTMQFIAVEDIGRIVARVFADPATYAGTTFDLAGDALTGAELAAKIGRATGRTITYARFSDELLAATPLLRRLVDLVDEGHLTGDADVAALRARFPDLATFDAWLDRTGRAAIERLGAAA